MTDEYDEDRKEKRRNEDVRSPDAAQRAALRGVVRC
jgi:hypothetical protein